MKNIHQVLFDKELKLRQLTREIDALHIVVGLLTEQDNDNIEKEKADTETK